MFAAALSLQVAYLIESVPTEVTAALLALIIAAKPWPE